MVNSRHNEGFRVLEDFVTDAIIPEVHPQVRHGRGVNADVHLISEARGRVRQQSISPERIAELRSLTSLELLALVQTAGAELSKAELSFIHELAMQRITQDNSSSSSDATLSREVFLRSSV